MRLSALCLAGLLTVAPCLPAAAQGASAARPTGAPPRPVAVWSDSMRYGGGPSIGAPPSDFTGKARPPAWCLQTDAQATGDFGASGGSWRAISRSWLRRKLSDTSETVWRRIVGDAPFLAPTDSITEVRDEPTCARIAAIVHREVLGFEGGPPPVVVFRVHDFLVVYPSNAYRGEFGYAIGMSPDFKVRGVVAW